MKVGFCVSTYERGGIGSVIRDEAKYLIKEGHKAKIVTLSKEMKTPKQVDSVELDEASEVNEVDYDLIHFHDGLPILREVEETQPIVATYHGDPPFYLKPNLKDVFIGPFYWFYYKRSLRKQNVGKVIAISDYVSSNLNIGQNKKEVLYNGVDTEKFSPQNSKDSDYSEKVEGEPVLMYSGAWVKQKCVSELIKALSSIKEKYPDAKLLIVGYGPRKEKIINLVNKLGLNQNIEIFESISDEKLVELYNLCDIYLTATKWESFCLPILEAMACGKPVIARKIPVIKEHAERTDAIQTYSKLNEIPKSIRKILSRYDYYSMKALDYAEKNSYKKHVSKLVKIYKRALK